MAAFVCSMLLILSPPAEAPDAGASEAEPTEITTHSEPVHLETRVAASTGAGAASNIKGRFRVHLDGNVFGFNHEREWFEDDHMPADDVEDVRNSVGVGIGQYNFGLGLGYGITDGLIVGLKAGVGFDHARSIDKDPNANGPDGIDSTISYAVLPYVEYAFIPGGRFRPFVFVHGGVAGSQTKATDSDDTAAFIYNGVAPVIGGGGGVHIFLIPQVSIDAFAEVDQHFVLRKTKVEIDGVLDPDQGDPDFVRNSLVTEFSVLVGISLWLGGG